MYFYPYRKWKDPRAGARVAGVPRPARVRAEAGQHTATQAARDHRSSQAPVKGTAPHRTRTALAPRPRTLYKYCTVYSTEYTIHVYSALSCILYRSSESCASSSLIRLIRAVLIRYVLNTCTDLYKSIFHSFRILTSTLKCSVK